jgi:hypothetical protein
MQVLLRKSDSQHDVQCTVCNQGFRVYWERTSTDERNSMRAVILDELRGHHSPENGNDKANSAHPANPFNLPGWSGLPQFSGAALLGGLSGVHSVAYDPKSRTAK